MKNLIRLRPSQTQATLFSHDLLDNADDYKLTDEDFENASRDDKILARMWVVSRVVSRFLYHWPMSAKYTDDMVSFGLEALCKCEELDDLNYVRAKVIFHIESELNNIVSVMSASLMTNRRRQQAGDPLEYASISGPPTAGHEDDELAISDLLDQLTPEDRDFYLEGRNYEA